MAEKYFSRWVSAILKMYIIIFKKFNPNKKDFGEKVFEVLSSLIVTLYLLINQ